MRQKLNIVTLGVHDFDRAMKFYRDGLRWKPSSASQDDIIFFPMGGVVFGEVAWNPFLEFDEADNLKMP